MKILAIESSCDETAAAVVEMRENQPCVLSNIVASQIDIHAKYGGVVPEVAARAHIENIVPTIKEALFKANLNLDDIDRIAVTSGPGLAGSLLVGVETAKAISIAKNIPIFPINHLEGHIYASFAREITNSKNQISNWEAPQFPLVALIVSGGNSLLIYMTGHFKYKVIGQTRDDAAGEAFDKGAKLMKLGYPGGPIISRIAADGDEKKYQFPIIDLTGKPIRNEQGFLEHPKPSLDFSFSGLKTALLTEVKRLASKGDDLTKKDKADLAAGYEKAIVATLVQNSLRAVQEYKPRTFVLAGGVAANKRLRDTLSEELITSFPNVQYKIPNLSLCGDNAAMIGAVAAFRKPNQANPNFAADPSLKL